MKASGHVCTRHRVIATKPLRTLAEFEGPDSRAAAVALAKDHSKDGDLATVGCMGSIDGRWSAVWWPGVPDTCLCFGGYEGEIDAGHELMGRALNEPNTTDAHLHNSRRAWKRRLR